MGYEGWKSSFTYDGTSVSVSWNSPWMNGINTPQEPLQEYAVGDVVLLQGSRDSLTFKKPGVEATIICKDTDGDYGVVFSKEVIKQNGFNKISWDGLHSVSGRVPEGTGYFVSISNIKCKVNKSMCSESMPSMSLKEKFLIGLKAEPEKSFRKVGITNGDDMLTGEGAQVFLAWLLKKYGADFKKEVVDSILEEQKESK